jgi:hypothetical protein
MEKKCVKALTLMENVHVEHVTKVGGVTDEYSEAPVGQH